MAGARIKKIVPKGFITGETRNADNLKAAERQAFKDAAVKRNEGTSRGGTSRKHKGPTNTEKRDLSFLKQTYLLDNVEEKILEQQKERMLTDNGKIREAIIPYTPSAHQLEVHELLEKKRFGVVVFHRGAGKRLAVDTWIPRLGNILKSGVKAGFAKLEDIEYGDILWGRKGETVVLEAHEEVEEEIYRVETRDGVIEACKDHLWQVALAPRFRTKESSFTKYGPKWEVMTTHEMMEAMKRKEVGKIILPRASAMECDDQPGVIDEYIYGLLLGRQLRKATEKGNGKSMLVTKKTIEEMKTKYPEIILINSPKLNRAYVDHSNVEQALNLSPGFLTTMNEKCIFMSQHRRMNLLKGLMDARGIVFSSSKYANTNVGSKSTQWSFISTNEQIGKMTYSLVRSLGWRALFYRRKSKTDKHPLYYVIFKPRENPFKHSIYLDIPLPNKHKNCLIDNYDVVREIKATNEQKKMRCLTVDSADGLFCVGKQFTLTHNTWLAINELIKRAWSCDLAQGGKFIYVAPEKLQAKKIAWKELKFFLKDVPCTVNETNLMITLPNNSTIELEGADNPDRIRGQHPNFVVLDEVAQMPRDTWYEAIYPSLRAHNGGALFIGTPKGDNLFRDLFDQAKNKNNWFSIKKTIYDTNVSTLEQIIEIKDSMPPSKFEQEYMCSFEASSQGTFFSHMFDNASRQLVKDVPYNPSLPIITSWDLGTTDMTSIWFAQVDVGGQIRLIDYYENTMMDIHHYISYVRNKPYVYDYHILPHDVTHVSWESNRSRLAIFKQHGMNVKIAKKYSVEEGISIAQTFLYTCVFDETNCQIGVNHLKQYRAKQDKITSQFTSTPIHDVHSNAADAFRMLAIGIKNNIVESNFRNSYANSTYDWLNPTTSIEQDSSMSYDIFSKI